MKLQPVPGEAIARVVEEGDRVMLRVLVVGVEDRSYEIDDIALARIASEATSALLRRARCQGWRMRRGPGKKAIEEFVPTIRKYGDGT